MMKDRHAVQRLDLLRHESDRLAAWRALPEWERAAIRLEIKYKLEYRARYSRRQRLRHAVRNARRELRRAW